MRNQAQKMHMKTKRSSKDSAQINDTAIQTHPGTAFSVAQTNSNFEVAEANRSVLEMIISLVLSCWSVAPGIARQVLK